MYLPFQRAIVNPLLDRKQYNIFVTQTALSHGKGVSKTRMLIFSLAYIFMSSNNFTLPGNIQNYENG